MELATVGMYASSLYIDGPSQTNQNFSIYALGNTTQATSQTINANALSFNALGAISAGASGGSIQFSYQTNEQLSIYAVSNLYAAVSGNVNASSIPIAGSGIASVGLSGGSIVISANQSNQQFSLYAGGATTNSTSGTCERLQPKHWRLWIDICWRI